jgi:chromosome segregation ATPase
MRERAYTQQLREYIDRMLGEFKKLQTTARAEAQKYQSEKSALTEREIKAATLLEQAERIRGRVMELEARHLSLNEDFLNERSKRQESEQAYASTKETLESMKHELAEIKAERDRLLDGINTEKRELEGRYVSQLDTLKAEHSQTLRQKDTLISSLSMSVRDANTEIARLKSELQSAQSALNEKETELGSLRSTAHDLEKTRSLLEIQIKALQSSQNEIKFLKNDRDQVLQTLRQTKELLAQHEVSLANVRGECELTQRLMIKESEKMKKIADKMLHFIRTRTLQEFIDRDLYAELKMIEPIRTLDSESSQSHD